MTPGIETGNKFEANEGARHGFGNLLEAQLGQWTVHVTRCLWLPGYTTEEGECEVWNRQVHQSYFGARFDNLWKGSAAETAGACVAKGYEVQNGRPGDIYFRVPLTARGHRAYTGKGWGHVGIRLWGNMIGENATVHASGGKGDARGVRTVSDWCSIKGAIIIVRLLPNLK